MTNDEIKKAQELSKQVKNLGKFSTPKPKPEPVKVNKDLSFTKKFTGIKQPEKPKKELIGEYALRYKDKPIIETPDEVVSKVNRATLKIDSERIDGLMTPNDVIEELKKNKSIDISHIRNGENLAQMAQRGINMNDMRWHGSSSGLLTVSHDATLTGDGTTESPLSVLETGLGTVTSVSVVTANGVSGSVATATTTPAITLALGAITPSAVQISGLTASEIVLTDASKNLVSAGVATYPSLTELTYLKGVTSAIQTQINTKAPTASPTFTGTVTIPALAMTGNITGGIFGTAPFLEGAVARRAVGSNLTTGNTDIYTCPANKRAYVAGVTRAYNPSAGSITYFGQIKVSGVYYRLSANVTLTTGTGGTTGPLATSIVLEAGESISINTATTNGLNIVLEVIEYNNTVPLYSPRVLTLSNGDNTLYTVPVGKSAITVATAGLAAATTSLGVCNNSGGSLNYIVYNVPSGGSSGSTNQLYPSAAIGDKATQLFVVSPTLATGDFVVVNTSAGTATQTAWLTVFEI